MPSTELAGRSKEYSSSEFLPCKMQCGINNIASLLQQTIILMVAHLFPEIVDVTALVPFRGIT